MTHQTEDPVSITSARTGRSADIKRRQSQYLISMGIRTVCFLLAVLIPGPARWVLLRGSVLPAVLRGHHRERRRWPRVRRTGAFRRPRIGRRSRRNRVRTTTRTTRTRSFGKVWTIA